MDHHVEPPSWLPEGAAPAVTDEAPAASGQAEAAGEQESPNGVHDDGQQPVPDPDPQADDHRPGAGDHGTPAAGTDPAGTDPADTDPAIATAGMFNGAHEPVAEDADPPLTYGQGGSYVYEQAAPLDYRQDQVPTPGYPAEDGYNNGMSQPGAGETPAPPYPAELPAQQTATAATSATAGPLAKPRSRARSQVQARRANLVIARFEPWSVMKFSFLMSLVAWLVLFVAVALLYYALSGLGVFGAIQRTLQSVTSSEQSQGVNLAAWTSASRVLGYTMLIGAVNIVLITVLSTIGAMIYNLVTHLGGGIEVTLKETD